MSAQYERSFGKVKGPEQRLGLHCVVDPHRNAEWVDRVALGFNQALLHGKDALDPGPSPRGSGMGTGAEIGSATPPLG